MTFADINIGEDFFDPYCGETFRKITETTAIEALTGQEDVFEPDDEVEPA